MHMLAALDLATGKIYYRIRTRKRHREFAELLKSLRARWPAEAQTSQIPVRARWKLPPRMPVTSAAE